MKHTIELFREAGQWMAKFSDPAIVELFGTDTIETAYTNGMEAKVVLESICALNPDCYVTLRDQIIH